MHHQAGILAGSWPNLTKLRYEVRTYSSDQGDELEVADTPLLFEEGVACVNDARVRLRAKQMNDNKIASAFFFPLVLAFADLLHITYNGFEESVKEYRNWKTVQEYLTGVVAFLSDRGLRTRFIQLVVVDPYLKIQLNCWSIHHGFNWKWEYMYKFLSALLPVYAGIMSCFDVAKFKGSKEWSQVHAIVIEQFGKAVAFLPLQGVIYALHSIALALDRKFGSWYAGCWCHQYLLEPGPGHLAGCNNLRVGPTRIHANIQRAARVRAF